MAKKIRQPFVSNIIDYDDEIHNIEITSSDFWYKKGEIFEVVKAILKPHYRTVDYIFRCEYGLINESDAVVI